MIQTRSAAPVLMEDHDGAYWSWKNAGFKSRTLLHFDAHIDFSWIAPSARSLLDEETVGGALGRAAESPVWDLSGAASESRVHLGNYIHEAIQAGIVGEFVWVYPDHPRHAEQSAAVERMLAFLSARSPKDLRTRQAAAPGHFTGTIYGRPFQALPFSSLGRFSRNEPVLLDVDVDFFIVRSLHAREYPLCDPARASFWLTPERFVERVRAAGVCFDHATIAYSVEEGYTPATLKFLGDELAARIEGNISQAQEETFEALRRIHEEPLAPRAKLDALARADAALPAVRFNAALARAEAGDWDGAREDYRAAVEADPAYRNRYNHPGQALLELGRIEEARPFFAAMSRLDPGHPAYRLFAFRRALSAGDRSEALSIGTGLFAAGMTEPGLVLGMASCRLDAGDHRGAERWLSHCDEPSLKIYERPRYWALKARAAASARRTDEAIDAYHGLLRCSLREPKAHLALAKLYARKGNWYKARKHAAKAIRRWER